MKICALQNAAGPRGRLQVPGAVRRATAQREVGRARSQKGRRIESAEGLAPGMNCFYLFWSYTPFYAHRSVYDAMCEFIISLRVLSLFELGI